VNMWIFHLVGMIIKILIANDLMNIKFIVKIVIDDDHMKTYNTM
jgi:hypothetical protein